MATWFSNTGLPGRKLRRQTNLFQQQTSGFHLVLRPGNSSLMFTMLIKIIFRSPWRLHLLGWLAAGGVCFGAPAPVILGPAVHDGSVLQIAASKFIAVGMNTNNHQVFQQMSGDGRTEWRPAAPDAALWAAKVMRDRDGQLHAIWMVFRGSGKKPAVDRFIDIWHARTSGTNRPWVRSCAAEWCCSRHRSKRRP